MLSITGTIGFNNFGATYERAYAESSCDHTGVSEPSLLSAAAGIQLPRVRKRVRGGCAAAVPQRFRGAGRGIFGLFVLPHLHPGAQSLGQPAPLGDQLSGHGAGAGILAPHGAYRIFFPSALSTSSTATSAVVLRTSRMGLTSTTSME